MTTTRQAVLQSFSCPLSSSSGHAQEDCPFDHTGAGTAVPQGLCVAHLLGRCSISPLGEASSDGPQGLMNITIDGEAWSRCRNGFHPTLAELSDLPAYRNLTAKLGGNIDAPPGAGLHAHSIAITPAHQNTNIVLSQQSPSGCRTVTTTPTSQTMRCFKTDGSTQIVHQDASGQTLTTISRDGTMSSIHQDSRGAIRLMNVEGKGGFVSKPRLSRLRPAAPQLKTEAEEETETVRPWSRSWPPPTRPQTIFGCVDWIYLFMGLIFAAVLLTLVWFFA